MNEYALLHTMDSEYAYASSEHDLSIRLRCAKGDLEKAYICYESKYRIAGKHIKKPMKKVLEGRLFDYYAIDLHVEDVRFAYVFYLYDGKTYKYYSEDGLTDSYDFSQGYYNFFQYPYINSTDVVRDVPWMHSARFYQIFVDRFNIGNKGKDMSYVNLKWGERPTPKSFAGGDLNGIREKLDYIKGLGINAIYLTPIFSSISNHKYDISDYYTVDSQFGTNEDLKELVRDCHEKGIRILLDAVFNHCSEYMPQFVDVCKKGRKSRYYNWFVIDGDKPDKKKHNYEVFAFCDYMPKLNTSNPDVVKYFTDVAVHYINEYDIDGWRLDVSDEVSHTFWRDFRKAVKSARPDAVIIGENWHNASNYLRGDQYDSIMNYSFTKCCLDFFAHRSIDAEMMAMRLNDILARNNNVVNDLMLNLLDSHDTSRFFTEVSEDRDAFINALCLLYLFPGAPCILYGTELMTPGGYDPDCRRCMDWDKAGKAKKDEVFKLIGKLAGLRGKHVLSAKDVNVCSENGLLIVKYKKARMEIVLIINNTGKKRKCAYGEVKASGRSLTVNGKELV